MMDEKFIAHIGSVVDAGTKRFGPLYYGLACAIQPKVIIEGGIYHGYATAWLAAAAREIGAKFYAIDNFNPLNDIWSTMEQVVSNLTDCGVIEHVSIIRGDAIESIEKLRDQGYLEGLGMVVLDDWHSYEHVLKELEVCWPLLGRGAVIGTHDTIYDAGPKHAIEEFAQRTGSHLLRFYESHGLTFLQKE